jgi:hypothetical protein
MGDFYGTPREGFAVQVGLWLWLAAIILGSALSPDLIGNRKKPQVFLSPYSLVFFVFYGCFHERSSGPVASRLVMPIADRKRQAWPGRAEGHDASAGVVAARRSDFFLKCPAVSRTLTTE